MKGTKMAIVSKKIQLITIAALMCANNTLASNPDREGSNKVTENVSATQSKVNTPEKRTYYDVMGRDNFRQMTEMDKNFYLYPNYPDLLFVGKHIGASDLLTPLDEQTEYQATVIELKPSSTVVKVNPSYDPALNNYQLTRQYKENYPEFGLGLGSLSGAVSSGIINHNASENVHKDVRMNNMAIGVGLLGLVVGSIVGNSKYNDAMKQSMLDNYKKVDTTIVYFKLNNTNSADNIGRFFQTNDNLLKSGNWKIGDRIKFYKKNHIWMFEKE